MPRLNIAVRAHLYLMQKEELQAQSWETEMMVDTNEITGIPEEDNTHPALETAMADAAADAIVVIDEEARIIAANRSVFVLFGYSLAEITRESLFCLIDPADRDRVTRRLVQNLVAGHANPEEKTTECVAVRKNGQSVPIEISLRPLGGSEPAFVGVIRDLTERKRAEEELRQVHDALRKSQKTNATGRLAAGLAHDFNNLLAVIIGFSDVLLHQMPEHECAWRHRVAEIKKAAKRAAGLTAQLLAFGRQQEFEPRQLDLNRVVYESREMLSGLLGAQIELALQLGADGVDILADAHQVEQVIINLALNARDAMPKGGTLRIETAIKELKDGDALRRFPMTPGHYVMLAVSDTGLGMDKGTQAHLFEPYFTTKALGQGTGLGLATVYGIVKRAGGFVWAESERGRGTTFEI